MKRFLQGLAVAVLALTIETYRILTLNPKARHRQAQIVQAEINRMREALSSGAVIHGHSPFFNADGTPRPTNEVRERLFDDGGPLNPGRPLANLDDPTPSQAFSPGLGQ